ncbi:MAG TPA: DUF4349 domain-containing protein, partial [Longimicrobium sp.]|nr:DUF4349 domain-containing protein [Longimicrobium sp.]
MRHSVLAPLLACLALASACGPSSDETAAVDAVAEAPTAPGGEAYDRGRSVGYAGAAAKQSPAPGAPASAADTGSGAAPEVTDTAARAAPMIIRDGKAQVEVDSLEPAMARVRRMATALGGYVGDESIVGGEHETRTATMQLKIPAARFDQALAGLKPIGKLESQNTTAQDVGEEFFDVTARMENARRLEERLISLLATRTGRLEDVLAVERELARVREEIERYQGRLRFLRSRVATSTLEVMLHEPGPIVGQPGEHPILDAFRQAWSNFVGFVAWFI